MKIGYLINHYPKPSHTFIRREILALEECGVQIERYSIRRAAPDLVDKTDLREAAKTRSILGRGLPGLLLPAAVEFCRSGLRALRAARICWGLARASSKGLLIHSAYLCEAAALKRMCREDGIQHLHTHFGTNSASIALLCAALGGPSYSLTIHGSEEFDHPQELSLPQKIGGATFVAAISRFCRSQIYRWSSHQHWHKVHLVPCGVDQEFLDQDPAPFPERPRILWIGRLAEEKGLPILLEACQDLADQGIDFEVAMAGDGPMRPWLEEALVTRGLTEKVRLLGWLDDAGIRREIQASRLLLTASFAEGLPVVLMEAMALGRPAIATSVAGIPELVEPGETGWLATPGDLDELIQCIRDALHCPESQLIEMGRKARERIRAGFDVRRSAATLQTLLKS